MSIFESGTEQMISPESDTHESENFPAAHSMDVAFFALDREGNVARFSAWLDEYSPTPSALQIDATRRNLANHVEVAIESCLQDLDMDGGRIAQASARKLVFSYVYQGEGEGESALFRADDLPPESPELLQAKLADHGPKSNYPLDYPWLSFDDASILRWPPQRPMTVAEWEQVINNAERQWLDAIDRLKSAERRQPELVAYWQKIADRRYASMEVLQQTHEGLK